MRPTDRKDDVVNKDCEGDDNANDSTIGFLIRTDTHNAVIVVQ